MRFKVVNTEVNISFTFLAVLLMMIVRGNVRLYFSVFTFSLLHEAIHLLFLLFFGASVKRVSFSIFGGNIEREKGDIESFKEAVVNLSAPAVNIIIGSVLMISGISVEASYINLFLGLFNILPFYNFDGGRGLYSLVLLKYDKSRAELVLFISSLLSVLAFIMLNFIIIFHNKINPVLLVINIYMLSCFIANIFKKSAFEA